MKRQLYNSIMEPGFINEPGKVMKVNSNDKYDVYIVSDGDGHTITFCVMNYKHQMIVFSYTLDIRELTYRDVNGLFYDLNDVINRSDPNDYNVIQWVLVETRKEWGASVGEILCCQSVYCNRQFKDVYRQHLLKKHQRDSENRVTRFAFPEVCEDVKYDDEFYLRCGMYVIESTEDAIISGSIILMIEIGEAYTEYLSVTMEYNRYLFPYPLIDDYYNEDVLNAYIGGLDEWHEIEDGKLVFVDRETKIQKLT